MIRRLGPTDLRRIECHFVALSSRDRLYRFNAPLGDSAISARIASLEWSSSILLGDFDGKHLRGLAELAVLRGDGLGAHEVALSVDRTHRRRGIARRLLAEAASRARSFGGRRLVFWWHPENIGFARFLVACGGTVSIYPPAGWLDIHAAGTSATPIVEFTSAASRAGQGLAPRNGRAV